VGSPPEPRQRYELVMQNKNWDSAAAYCQQQYNGHLAAIRTVEEQYAIVSYIERMKKCKQQSVLSACCLYA